MLKPLIVVSKMCIIHNMLNKIERNNIYEIYLKECKYIKGKI